jgi:hypothetical protein
MLYLPPVSKLTGGSPNSPLKTIISVPVHTAL